MKCKNLRIIITILLGTFIMTGCSFAKRQAFQKVINIKQRLTL